MTPKQDREVIELLQKIKVSVEKLAAALPDPKPATGPGAAPVKKD